MSPSSGVGGEVELMKVVVVLFGHRVDRTVVHHENVAHHEKMKFKSRMNLGLGT